MLDVRVNGESLDLGKFSISFELLSPVFNEIGSFSYPFSFPATEKNKSLLGFPHRINISRQVTQKANCELYLNGLLWKRGNLVFTEAGKYDFKAYFTVGEGYFYSTIKDLKLVDIDLGGIRNTSDYSGTGVNDLFSKIISKSFPDNDFALFPVQNANFYDDLSNDTFSAAYSGKINKYDSTLKFNIDGNTIVPFPYLNYVIGRIFKNFGLVSGNNDLYNNAFLRNLVMLNNVASNVYTASGETFNVSVKPAFNLNDHVPDITCLDFFTAVQNQLLAFVFINEMNGQTDIRLFENIIRNPEVVDFSKNNGDNILIYEDQTDGYEVEWDYDNSDNLYDSSFNPGANLPVIEDISRKTFIGSWASSGVLPGGVSPESVAFAELEQSYYAYRWDGLVYAWRQISHPFTNFGIGKKRITFNVPAAVPSIMMEPVTYQPGTFFAGKAYKNDFGFRLAFFDGLFSGSVPMGGSTYSIYAPDRKISLAWHGQYGIYENFYKGYIGMKTGIRKADFKKILTLSQLKAIDFAKKYRFNEANWLLASVKFSVSNNMISPATIGAYKV